MESAQREVRKALLRGRKLTTLDIFNDFKAMRGSVIIHRLRMEGMDIETEMIDTPTGKRVARYSVKEAL